MVVFVGVLGRHLTLDLTHVLEPPGGMDEETCTLDCADPLGSGEDPYQHVEASCLSFS